MAKRKLSMSLIVLIVAATTLISGTYAWFLVGGFAELFDLGFDVIEAAGGLEIQGSAGTAKNSKDGPNTESGWGVYLDRENFAAGDLLPKREDGGKYTPVSSLNADSFKWIMIEDGFFRDKGTPSKGTHYNDFTIKARSEAEGSTVDAKMTIEVSGKATVAARVAVVVDGTTTVYAMNDGKATQAVTGDVEAVPVQDLNNNFIIDSDEAGILSAQNATDMTPDGDNYKAEVSLSGLDHSGKTIRVVIWIEGNDPQCTAADLRESSLNVKIKFRSAE